MKCSGLDLVPSIRKVLQKYVFHFMLNQSTPLMDKISRPPLMRDIFEHTPFAPIIPLEFLLEPSSLAQYHPLVQAHKEQGRPI